MTFSTKAVSIASKAHAVWIFLCGLMMGAMDVIPGISGGTVAFILGIYEELISAIRSIKFQSPSKIAWQFLGCLISGIALSFISFATVFDYLLKQPDYRIYLYATFTGLISGSVIYLARQMKAWGIKEVIALLIGALIAYKLTDPSLLKLSFEPHYDVEIALSEPAANYKNGILQNVSQSQLEVMLAKGWVNDSTVLYENGVKSSIKEKAIIAATPRLNLWAIVCGMIAISAMLLPGISGSYLLNVLGMYGTAIAALADLGRSLRHFSFDIDAFMLLFSIGIGIFFGAILFSRVIGWLLTRYHAFTIALLTGFMVGAMQSVWPFWSFEFKYNPLKLSEAPSLSVIEPVLPTFNSNFFISILFFALGLAVLFFFEWVAHKKNSKT